MFVSRVLSRVSKTGLNHYRGVFSSTQELSPIVFNNFHSLRESSKSVALLLRRSVLKSVPYKQFQFISSTSTSSQPTNKESNQPEEGDEKIIENNDVSKNGETSRPEVDTNDGEQMDDAGSCGESKPSTQKPTRRRRVAKRTAFSDSDTEDDLSRDDLVNLIAKKEELLKAKHKEIEKMQDKILQSYAEMESVMDRTKREAENSKRFAIQNFAKGLLDVADNLGRASSVVKDSYSKIDSSKDTVGAFPLLKTLLEGVEMTEKQLIEVLRKFGVEKFDPMNEQFDPHRHLAVFQTPDASKPPGTVAAVLKSGYMLYDRIIRPAEVGVTQASDNESDQSSGA